MDLKESIARSQQRCPHCGRLIEPDRRITFTFHNWSTIVYMILISVTLIGIDFVQNGKYSFDTFSFASDFIDRTEWSKWAVLGMWIFYLPSQYLRSRPQYGWIIIPIFGLLFNIFFIILDKLAGPNEGFMGLDWAWYVFIPLTTFVVAFPLVARISRIQPTYIDQLSYLVDNLSTEADHDNKH